MTEEEAEKWFEQVRRTAPKVMSFDPDSGMQCTFWDDMFQAFIARAKPEIERIAIQAVKREATTNLMPHIEQGWDDDWTPDEK